MEFNNEIYVFQLSEISHVLLNRKVVIGCGLMVFDWHFFDAVIDYMFYKFNPKLRFYFTAYWILANGDCDSYSIFSII